MKSSRSERQSMLSGISIAHAIFCTVAGVLWLLLVYDYFPPALLTASAWIGIVAGVIAALLFSTPRFKQLVHYQQKVWHIRLEVIAEMKKSSTS